MTQPGKEQKHKIKNDILLFVTVIVIGLVGLLLLFLFDGKGNGIKISVAGGTYGYYSLAENREIVIDTESGRNTIMIRDGQVWMESADCPDGYCIKHGVLKSQADPIVCLPHKVVVELIGEAMGEDIDGVTR